MMNIFVLKNSFLILLCILLIACSAPAPRFHLPESTTGTAQKLVVFIDGTANDEASYTNVSKLRNLVVLQKRTDIKSVYIEGVGTGYRLFGMGTGLGFSSDIKQSYEFLTIHYQSPENKIHLFGFSRGAYAVRALAGFVQVTGVPNFSGLTDKQRKKAVKELFNVYKSVGTVQERQARLKEKHIKFYNPNQPPVEVEFVGIWDTVEALAIPDYEEVNILKGKDYIDQLCNVKKIAHALSLDDDRARIFTPLLLTKHAAKAQCGKNPKKVEQVFFSGAHSDVGGGYDDTDIDGISLNWMLSKVWGEKLEGLVPKNTKVYADAYGKTHDPESGWASLAYHFQHRNLSKYHAMLDGSLTVHPAVIDRLACIKQQYNETQWDASDNLFRSCFSKSNGVYNYLPNNPKCVLKKAEPVLNYDKKVCTFTQADDSFSLNGVRQCTNNANEELPCVAHKLIVNPKDKYGWTGANLQASQHYKFTLKTNNWNDHGLCATPENGRRITRSDSSLLMKGALFLGKPFSYSIVAGYMELLGEVEDESIRVGQLASNGEVYSPKKTGTLILKVNEPRFSNDYYENNNGSAMLFVTRVR